MSQPIVLIPVLALLMVLLWWYAAMVWRNIMYEATVFRFIQNQQWDALDNFVRLHHSKLSNKTKRACKELLAARAQCRKGNDDAQG